METKEENKSYQAPDAGFTGNAQRGVPDPTDKFVNDAYKKISLLQELYVEFFGTFIPGFVLVVTSAILMVAFVVTFFDQHPWASINSDTTWKLHWYVAVFIIILSYVVGAIIYRTEPNRPDRIASYKQWKRSSATERLKLAVQYPEPDKPKTGEVEYEKPSHKTAWCIFKSDLKGVVKLLHFSSAKTFFEFAYFRLFKNHVIEAQGVDASFPYPNLREYLIRRGLNHLVEYVPWCAKNGTLDHRTKVVINILKTRIRATYVYPIIQDIVRNEGHIRLMTSIWHVALYLRRFAFCFLALSIAWGCHLYSCRNDYGTSVPQYLRSVKDVDYDTVIHAPNEYIMFAISIPDFKVQVKPKSGDIKFALVKRCLFLFGTVHMTQARLINATWILAIYALVILSATLAKGAIEKSIHYVRNREVVMILESACTIEQMGAMYKNLFAEFHKRNTEFLLLCDDKTDCRNCAKPPIGKALSVYDICTGKTPAVSPKAVGQPSSPSRHKRH